MACAPVAAREARSATTRPASAMVPGTRRTSAPNARSSSTNASGVSSGTATLQGRLAAAA